ncbi:MAG TPA: hypothetical protein VFO77_07675 [Actinoplanes sp.]|nr:hypothetical protein [Actinoplanes sp.]
MDSLWWTVWWPWALVWTITVAAAAASGYLLIAHWRARAANGQPARGISLYLHSDAVMDLYLGGVYKTALRQEVEEELSKHTDFGGNGSLWDIIGFTGNRTVDRKVFRKYIEVAEPITVIRIVMEVLEKADDIVYVDLIDGSIEHGRALRKALRSATRPTEAALSFADLSDLEVYVSVRGRFRQLAATPEVITFAASCGHTAPTPPQAHLTCQVSGMRHEVPQGAFQGRCVGRVRHWDPDAGRLVIDPIAIFK